MDLGVSRRSLIIALTVLALIYIITFASREVLTNVGSQTPVNFACVASSR